MLLRNVGISSLAALAGVSAFIGCRNATQNTRTADEPRPLGNATPYNPPMPDYPPVRQPNASATAKTPRKSTTNPEDNKRVQTVPEGATASLSSRDSEIIGLQKEPLSNGKSSGDSTRWLSVGNGFKAEFRADSGSSAWNRVKVDLDSDKKWDEKWDFKADGSIKRRVSPSDDDNYSAEYRLKSDETKWVRVK
ncbi:MAG: hypothetical protein H7145_01580 [Akkermansiaceae bacterium]|nr:hypothetical protein [Armatimonadota bacterium]